MSAVKSVLVLDPPFGSDARDACIDSLTDGVGSAAVLSVLYSESVAERTRLIERHSEVVDSAAIVRVGPAGDRAADYESHPAMRHISDPADLTGLGIAVTDWLSARTDPTRAAICVDSLSTMLQYVDHDRALNFVHTVTSKCRRSGVTVHCHLDPKAHDEQTVAQLRQLFDEQRRIESPSAADANRQPVATDGGPPAGQD